ESLAVELFRAGVPAGWAALALAAFAAWRWARTHAAEPHVLGVVGLLAGVLAGCTTRWLGATPWQAHQGLVSGWSTLGLAFGLLALSATAWPRGALRGWQEGLGGVLILVGVAGSLAGDAPLAATVVPLVGAVALAGCMAVGYGEPLRVYVA